MKENCTGLSFEHIEQQFTGFLMKSVKGLRLDYLRRQRRFETEIPTDQLEAYLHKIGAEYSYEIEELGNEDLSDALSTLSEKQKTVIQLVVILDLTEKTAADILGVTQQGVHQAKKRALLELKKKLEV
ncbi:MAG: sigma-70 family RNA polymerase sigma factor [Defluviitaleaceae bacterium]|nr:sigma-70 family RNA polymerase sigma factor [Defluviitaleaceae bacterium]